MFGPLICGSSHHPQDEDEALGSSPCSTPRRSSRKSSKDSKNPYSTLGLDKFSALLADLEEKRAKIYSQMGSQDISLVRFAYSSSNDCVPIVVKLKDQNKACSGDKDETKDHKPRTTHKAEALEKSPTETSIVYHHEEETEKKRILSWNFKSHVWKRPSCYIPVFVVFVLLFLAFFGRSVAILCTSIGWYLVPTLSSKKTAKTKKKQLLRRFSEISPRSNKNFGDLKQKSSHGRQNSF